MLTMTEKDVRKTFNYNEEYIIANQINEEVLGEVLQTTGQTLLENDEIFVMYPDYNRYYVSNYGRVISFCKKQPEFLKQSKYNRYWGYIFYSTVENGIKKPNRKVLVGRAVADVFCPNFYKDKERRYLAVHHIDHDKTNNKWTNLVLLPKSMHEKVVHPLEKKRGIMDPFEICVAPSKDGNLYPERLK